MQELLQAILLVTDGIGIFASYTLSRYYRYDRYTILLPYYVLFTFLTGMFVFLTCSDLIVVYMTFVLNYTPEEAWFISWLTFPSVRGLVGRVPLALVELWMIHRIYGNLLAK